MERCNRRGVISSLALTVGFLLGTGDAQAQSHYYPPQTHAITHQPYHKPNCPPAVVPSIPHHIEPLPIKPGTKPKPGDGKDPKPGGGETPQPGGGETPQPGGGDGPQPFPPATPPAMDPGLGAEPITGDAGAPTSDVASAGGTSAPDLFGDIFASGRTGVRFNALLFPNLQQIGQPGVTPGVAFAPAIPPATTPTPTALSPVTVNVANPAGGGNVGRTKLAEWNNPLPRDRVFVIYDFFHNVPADPFGLGVDVHRIAPGIEKTFMDGRGSVEVRVPFASTLNSDINAPGLTNDRTTELGNVFVTLKYLVFSGSSINAAAGLGVSIPTADDTRVAGAGADLFRIENEAFLLTPYFAVLCTPNDRLFAQFWAQTSFDANGNPVLVNQGALTQVGKLTDQTLLQLDAQVGYWLYRSDSCCGPRRGVATFVELHYNTTISDPDQISLLAGDLVIGNVFGDINELNLTAGILAQVRDNLQVSCGIVTPLMQDQDRFFDYQIGARVNWFFGAGGGNRTQPGYYASSY